MSSDYEGRRKYFLRDFLLQLVLVIIFALILVFLLPKAINSNNTTSVTTSDSSEVDLSPLTNELFSNHIDKMKEAALLYFTTDRLPSDVGDEVKITLQEMLDKKLLISFLDKNGETCDTENSYVSITKEDDEYLMKVYLKCSEEEDYILVHIGCYSYCTTTSGVCESTESSDKTTSVGSTTGSSGSGSTNKTTTGSTTTVAGPNCVLEISSGTTGSNGWYTGNVKVRFKSMTTTTSGATITSYGITTSSSATYNSNSALTVSKNGTTKVYGYVKDSNGKTAVCTITVKKDTDEPDCNLSILSGTKDSSGNYVGSVKVGLSKTDSTSGILSYGMGTSKTAAYNGKTTLTVSTVGTTKVYGYVKDRAGHTKVCSTTIKIVEDASKSTPSCELEISSGTLGSNSWYTSNVKVRFKSMTTTGSSTITSYGISTSSSATYNGNSALTVSKDGTTKVYGYVKDSNGKTAVCTITVKKDTVDPDCNVEVLSGVKNSSGNYVGSVKIGFTSKTDKTSGVSAYGITLSNIPTYNGKSSMTLSSKGTYTVYGYVKDNAGNTKVCSTKLTIDSSDDEDITSIPSCELEVSSGTLGNNNWYTSNVVIKFKSKTTTNGATITGYGLGTSTNYNGSSSYTVSKDGTSTIYGYVKDSNGNTATCSITVKKDATAPDCSLVVTSGSKNSSGNYVGTVKVGFSSKLDSTSGVSAYGMGTSNSPTYNSASSYSTSTVGSHTVYGYVKDKAGNTKVCSISFKIVNNTSKPSCELEVSSGTLGNNNWYTSNVVIKFKSKSSTNGATITSYGLGTSTNYNGSTSYTVNSDGTKTIYGYVKDSNGYTATCSITIKRDATKPNCELEVTSGTLASDGSYTSNITIGFKSRTDATSGMNSYGIGTSTTYANNTSYTVSSNGTHTIYGYVKDKAGNTNVCSITVKKKSVTYEYQYSKSIAATYSSWSSWTTKSYTCSNPPSFTNTSTYQATDLGSSKTISGYTYSVGSSIKATQVKQTGTVSEKSCSGWTYYKTSTTSTKTYAIKTADDWTYVGLVSLSSPPTDTLSTKYVFVGMDWDRCGSTCTTTPYTYWKKYTRSVSTLTATDTITTGSSVTTKCTSYETKNTILYTTYSTIVGYEKTRTINYTTTCSYKYRTRSLLTSAYTDYKWSTYNDTTLINAGYTMTGTKRVAS